MRIATRLVLTLSGILVVAMAAYIFVSHRQRESLLREQTVRETNALGQGLRVVATQALRDERLDDLEEVLQVVARSEEVFASVVLDARGPVLAGAAADLECLRRALPTPLPTERPASGWADCDPRVHWVALPLAPPAATLVIGQREVLLDRSVAAALRRQLLLTLTLMLLLGLAIVVVLERSLSAPLARLEQGIRSLAGPGPPMPIELPESGGELARLAAAFNELAAQLEQKREQLRREAEDRVQVDRRLRDAEKFAVIGRLSGGLAHELGSPLSVIALRAEAIRAAPDDMRACHQQAEEISNQVRRLSDFIRGLLHIGRRQGIVYEPLDLVQTVRAALDELEPRLRQEEVALQVGLPADTVRVRGQETLLRHALRNLVRNSLHALRAMEGERRIGVRLEASEHEARVLIEDTGPGIPPDQLERVFEPFYTTKEIGQGMGLGLPITRGIIEEHGGELHLENLPGDGLRAVLVLPTEAREEESGNSNDREQGTGNRNGRSQESEELQ